MNICKILFSEFQSRWQIIMEENNSATKKIFAAMEIFCFPVSMLSIIALIVQLIVFACGYGNTVPQWWVNICFPILLSGAIGYLTNWLAIIMLFRPYIRKKWFFIWPQGLIPRNKPAIAHAMGDEVGNGLLNIDKIIAELSQKLHDYLQRPEIISQLKEKFRLFLQEHQENIANFLVPHIRTSLYSTLDNFLTAESMRKLYDRVVEPLMKNDEHQKAVSAFITQFGSKHLEKIVEVIRLRMREHLNTKLSNIPVLSLWSDNITNMVMDFFADRNSIEQMIANWLNEPATEEMVLDLMEGLRCKAKEWINSPEAQKKLEDFSVNFRNNIKEMIGSYLQNSLPKLLEQAVNSEMLWNWIENKMLPQMVDKLYSYIQENKSMLLNNLNLAERIETAINSQKVEQFHTMINKIAAEHLGAIQVLGYVLGVIIGLLQLVQHIILTR